jgi:hypothetical protein
MTMQTPEHLTQDIDADELCELAMENEGGPLEAIKGLIEGLLVKHSRDPATTAALTAIMSYHLPDLIELTEENAGAAR